MINEFSFDFRFIEESIFREYIILLGFYWFRSYQSFEQNVVLGNILEVFLFYIQRCIFCDSKILLRCFIKCLIVGCFLKYWSKSNYIKIFLEMYLFGFLIFMYSKNLINENLVFFWGFLRYLRFQFILMNQFNQQVQIFEFLGKLMVFLYLNILQRGIVILEKVLREFYYFIGFNKLK